MNKSKILHKANIPTIDVKMSLVNKKHGYCYCSCGDHGVFKDYYNVKRFYCENVTIIGLEFI